MSVKRLTQIFGFLFFLLAGVTWVSGEAGQGAEGRITLADMAGAGLVGLWLLTWLMDKKMSLRMPATYRAYLPLLLVFTLGVLAARYPMRGALELLIHVFIFIVALALFNLYSRLPPADAVKSVLMSILWAGGILAILGLVDFFVWPSLLPGVGNGLVGTFRNTGQAGAFFGVYLAILVPAFLSGIIKSTQVNIILVLSIVFALIFTSKRAALIGFGAGVFLLAASMMLSQSKRDKKIGLLAALAISLLLPMTYLAFQWGLENIEGMAWRFEKKFNANTAEDFREGFLAENIEVALTAFELNPLLGVGLGNVAGVVSDKYEIHSTYLSILGNGGLLGVLAYIVFLGVKIFAGARSVNGGRFGMYLRYYIPMFCGLVLSWGYTYHLRKREFWILCFVVSLIIYVSRRSRYDEKIQSN